MKNVNENQNVANVSKSFEEKETSDSEQLLFGVDINAPLNNIMQNNITQFEWIVRNKVYPVFCGRNIFGKNCLTKEEINFIHKKGCRIAPFYRDSAEKSTEKYGVKLAEKVAEIAYTLCIPIGTAIYLEIGDTERVTTDFLKGFANKIIYYGYVPGFKANTDAKFNFDREFSRGMQTNSKIFEKCLVWAVAPVLDEFDKLTTTHIIQPDNWSPYAPSGITRRDIAVWQYGRDCHPIEDDSGDKTVFNINLIRNKKIINEKMF